MHLIRHRAISLEKSVFTSRLRAAGRELNQRLGKPSKVINKLLLQRYDYQEAAQYALCNSYAPNEFPSVVANWDTTPRYQDEAVIFENASPQAFAQHVRNAISLLRHHEPEKRIVFLHSWNEWAEGNYVEPDERFGRGRLEALKDELARLCEDA